MLLRAGQQAGVAQAAGQQAESLFDADRAMDHVLIVTSDRDRRTLAWLRQHFSDDAILAAAESLPGKRKAFLSNICKVLGTVPPANLSFTSRDDAKIRMGAVRELLKSSRIARNR